MCPVRGVLQCRVSVPKRDTFGYQCVLAAWRQGLEAFGAVDARVRFGENADARPTVARACGCIGEVRLE